MERARKVNINQKVFHLRKSEIGKKVLLEERRGSRLSRKELDLGIFAWVRDCLVAVSSSSNPSGFWRRRRLDIGIIFFQVLANAKGRFGLLSIDLNRRRRPSIFIPEGSKVNGWGSLATTMTALLPPVVSEQKEKKGYGSVVQGLGNNKSYMESVRDGPELMKEEKVLFSEDIDFAFDCSSTVIVERRSIKTEWFGIKDTCMRMAKIGFSSESGKKE